MDALIELFSVSIIPAIFVIIVIFGFRNSKKKYKTAQLSASSLNLNFHQLSSWDSLDPEWAYSPDDFQIRKESKGKTWLINGQYNNYKIMVRLIQHGSGRSSTTCTRYVLYFNNKNPVEIKISASHLFSKIGNKIGLLKKVSIGDKELDETIMVQYNDSKIPLSFLKKLKDEKFKIGLNRILKSNPYYWEINNNSILLDINGIKNSKENIQNALEILTNIGNHLD